MAEYRSYRRRPRKSTRALTARLTALAVVATLIIGGLLAAQMAAGNDPALGPKATAGTKKSTASPSNSGSSSSSSSGAGTDPYTQQYGYGYGSGSSGYSAGSGYSTQQSPPAPVTSGTS
jgi:hypothetical protein